MPPPRPHLLARSPNVDRLNGWLETLWRKGYAPPPSLDPEEMWVKALAKHDLADEVGGRSAQDVADFRERLQRLCSAAREEARLNPLGRTMAHGQLQRVVFQRLQLGRLWRQRPDLLETPLAPPILVVGQQRSGTTRVHRLLAADPAFVATPFCDSWNPVPRRPDLRPFWSWLSLRLGQWINPWLQTIHPTAPRQVDEELGWLAAALGASTYEAQWHIPSYSAFSEGRDAGALYREFARILRTDAAFHGNAHRARVMKVPEFTENLPSLIAAFPEARIVVTRRDEREIGPSMVSMFANQMAIQSDAADLSWIEREVARKIALRKARVESALADFSGPMAVVDFTAFDDGWEPVMSRVYSELGIPLSKEARIGIEIESTRSQKGAHRVHSRQYAR
ncbi:hypothetical protein AAW00_01065 [Aurantiacibacter luteus]|uniref:Sulfotransferase n=1 Tax=Aurantiacibacter luteus TaxID=1581420 RepID=A0A0G9MZI8_9SPHN|nr:hypothetical protein AAW00_01065 [Aurantiacibacter luteus]